MSSDAVGSRHSPSASGNVESGGDGDYIKYGTFRSEVEMKDVFARFSLDLGDSANWYVQGSWAQAENASDWIQWVVSPNPGRPNTLFANNPYLDTATQAQMGANVDCSTLTASDPAGWRCLPIRADYSAAERQLRHRRRRRTPWFTVPSFTLQPGRRHRSRSITESPVSHPRATRRTGTWKRVSPASWAVSTWEVYYSRSESELTVTNPNNTDNAKYLAALDAVNDARYHPVLGLDPAGSTPASIRAACRSTSSTPMALRRPRMTIYAQSTSWLLTQEMDNIGASIGGGLWGFGLPAGEIVANLSVDARWSTYVMDSDFAAHRLRQLHGPAHVPAPRTAPAMRRPGTAALGAEHER